MQDDEEYEVVRRLKSGDIQALEKLVNSYQVEAKRVAYLIVRDRGIAEDIVQAAFVRAYERRGQIDASRSFRPWFLKIVSNDAIKTARRRSREITLIDNPDSGHQLNLNALLGNLYLTPEEQVEQADIRRAVWDAIGTLPVNERTVVVLRYYAGLKQREVSEQIGRPLGTVKRLLHFARARLRGTLMHMNPTANNAGEDSHGEQRQRAGTSDHTR